MMEDQKDRYAAHMLEAFRIYNRTHRPAIERLNDEFSLDMFTSLTFDSLNELVPYKDSILFETLVNKLKDEVLYQIKAQKFIENALAPKTFIRDMFTLFAPDGKFRPAKLPSMLDWMLNTNEIMPLLKPGTTRMQLSNEALAIAYDVEPLLLGVLAIVLERFITDEEDYQLIQNGTRGKRYIARTDEENRECSFYAYPQVTKGCDVWRTIPGSVLSKVMTSVRSLTYTLDENMAEVLLAVMNTDEYKEKFHSTKEELAKGFKSKTANKAQKKYANITRGLTQGLADWETVGKKAFHLSYRFDFRGRLYPLGAINPTSGKMVRPCLRAGVAEPLGRFGYNRLLEAYSAYTTAPKEIFDRRLEVGREKELEAVALGRVIDQGGNAAVQKMMEVLDLDWESPVRAAQVAVELYRISNHMGNVEKYCSDVFITYDGSNNAAQHYALAAKNPELAESVNCWVGADTEIAIHDLYGKLSSKMFEASKKFKPKDTNAPYMKWYRDLDCARTISKRLLMPRMYGAKHGTWFGNVKEVLEDKKTFLNVGRPRKFFKATDGPIEDQYYSGMAKAIADLFKAVYENDKAFADLITIETYLKDIARAYTGNSMHMEWLAPEHADYSAQSFRTRYLNEEGELVRKKVNGKTYRIRLYKMADAILGDGSLHVPAHLLDTNRTVSSCPPSWVHSRDAYIMHRCITTMVEEHGATGFNMCHDSMAVVPGKSIDLLLVLKDLWEEVYGGEKSVFESLSKKCEADTGVWVDYPVPMIKNMSEGMRAAYHSYA